MRHVYIKPQTPQLNGEVELSHRVDQTKFYQLLTYTDDMDLNVKPKAWENFYNYDRTHLYLDGRPFWASHDGMKTDTIGFYETFL